jgi:hypothetical protein
MIKENEFYSILLKEKAKGILKVVAEDIEIIPNYQLKDSPDFVLILKLKIEMFSRTYLIEIPLPLELEKVGIDKALDDLTKFIDREKFEAILPMLVVSDKTVLSDEKEGKLKTVFKISQIPERYVRY